MIRNFSFIIIFLCSYFNSFSQNEISLSLEDVIQKAQGITQQTAVAKTRLNNSEWSYIAFKGGFKPKLSLQGTLPLFSRGVDLITQPDGTELFISRSILNAGVDLSLSQVIPQTGGTVFASFGLDRNERFIEDQDNVVNWRSAPIQIGFNQGLFAFNRFKWDKQIQPLRQEEGQKRFTEEMENLAFDAVDGFFTYYIGQLNYEAAQRDKMNADSLLESV